MATHTNSTPALTHDVMDVQNTTCCIVGGGSAGAVLALLLARQCIPVIILETHKDFDRDFRGDTIHPSVMEIMAEIGLGDRLLQLPHAKIHHISKDYSSVSSIPTQIFSHVLNLDQSFKPPAWLRLPILRDLPTRLIAFGVFPAHLQTQTNLTAKAKQ